MNQGDPLSPTILNLVVDAVFSHWVTVVAGTEESVPPGADNMEGFGRDMQSLEAYFYEEDGLITPTQETCLQRYFDTQTELFDRVGLQTNVIKMVSINLQPCRALGGHLEESYGPRMTGESHYFWDRLRQIFHCPDCNMDQAEDSLADHQQGEHGLAWGYLKDPPPPHPPDEAGTYRILLPREACGIDLPVGGCPGRETSCRALQVHFVHHHMRDTVVILEEGSHTLPCCPNGDILVTWRSLNGKHKSTTMCDRRE